MIKKNILFNILCSVYLKLSKIKRVSNLNFKYYIISNYHFKICVHDIIFGHIFLDNLIELLLLQ